MKFYIFDERLGKECGVKVEFGDGNETPIFQGPSKVIWKTCGQDGGIARYTLPPHTTKRTKTNLKAKGPELPESQIVCKSDDQGVKVETFILTGSWARRRFLLSVL